MSVMKENINKSDFLKKLNEIGEIFRNYDYEDNISLMAGNSGSSLFLFYYSFFTKDKTFYKNAKELIERSFHAVQEGNVHPSFAVGLAGLGWLMEHLSQNNFLDIDTSEVLGELDSFLYQAMISEIKLGNFDYMHSASGLALYFLSRKSNPNSDRYLNDYVDILTEHCEFENNCCKWQAKMLAKHDPIMTYNFGMSHGLASIIAILSKISQKWGNNDKIERLIEGTVNYLLSNRLDIKEHTSHFPNFISSDGNKSGASRLAWCYGDLGISIALWNASKVIDDAELEKNVIEVLLHTTKRRDLHTNQVKDAGLCHGTSGIAHIYNRMHINTGISEFKETSNYWFNKTLEFAKFEDGLAGFKYWRHGIGWANDYGFLEGIAGIGLALISYVSDIEPAWDECLLLS